MMWIIVTAVGMALSRSKSRDRDAIIVGSQTSRETTITTNKILLRAVAAGKTMDPATTTTTTTAGINVIHLALDHMAMITNLVLE